MGGRRRLIWSADADADLISIWHHGARVWSDSVADDHLLEIQYRCEHLLDAPMLGKERDDLLVGIRSLSAKPHVIFYLTSQTTVEIVRVLHQRMDIESVFESD
jgi:toxin ParE1/3/4